MHNISHSHSPTCEIRSSRCCSQIFILHLQQLIINLCAPHQVFPVIIVICLSRVLFHFNHCLLGYLCRCLQMYSNPMKYRELSWKTKEEGKSKWRSVFLCLRRLIVIVRCGSREWNKTKGVFYLLFSVHPHQCFSFCSNLPGETGRIFKHLFLHSFLAHPLSALALPWDCLQYYVLQTIVPLLPTLWCARLYLSGLNFF